MTAVLGNKGFTYGRFGLALVGLGMGLHLVSGTLNQAALARGQARLASAAWLLCAALFVVFMASGHAGVSRVEIGYFGATAVLCVLLFARVPARRRARSERPGGRDDPLVGGDRVIGSEHRGAGDEQVRAGLHARSRGLLVHPPVHLERDAVGEQVAHPL